MRRNKPECSKHQLILGVEYKKIRQRKSKAIGSQETETSSHERASIGTRVDKRLNRTPYLTPKIQSKINEEVKAQEKLNNYIFFVFFFLEWKLN